MLSIFAVLFTLVLCFLLKKYLSTQDELSEKSSILAARKDELDASAKKWKNRVEKSDAVNFTVAGRMQDALPQISLSIQPCDDKTKRTPKARNFKGKDGLYIYIVEFL